MRRGTTLIEILALLVMIALVSGIGVPRFRSVRDRVAADAGATAVVALLSLARHAAVRRAIVTAVVFDTAANVVVVRAGAAALASRPLGTVHGVALAVTRDSIAFAPNGMGYGAANTRVIVSRGAAAETVTVSRLGRVHR